MESITGFTLPERYQHDHLHIMARNHDSLFVYWELSDRKRWLLSQYFECPYESLITGLRIYNVTGVYFQGGNAHRYTEIKLETAQSSAYIGGLEPEATYVADFGVITKENQFVPVIRSNSMHLPRIGICGDGAIPIGVVDEARSERVWHRISPQFHENFLPFGLR
jgi:hypothetical protein